MIFENLLFIVTPGNLSLLKLIEERKGEGVWEDYPIEDDEEGDDDDEPNGDKIKYFIPSLKRYDNITLKPSRIFIIDTEKKEVDDRLYFEKPNEIAVKDFGSSLIIKRPKKINETVFNESILENLRKKVKVIVKSKIWEEYFGAWNRSFIFDANLDYIYKQFPGLSYKDETDVLIDFYAYRPFTKGDLKHFSKLRRFRNTTKHPVFNFYYEIDVEGEQFDFNQSEDLDAVSRLHLSDYLKDVKYLQFRKNSREAGPLPRRTVSYGEYLFGAEFNLKLDEEDIAFYREQDRKLSLLRRNFDKELSNPERDAEFFSSEFLLDLGHDDAIPGMSRDSDEDKF